MSSFDDRAIAERRSARRQQVAYRLDVITREGLNGCLLDISTTGMRVRFSKGLDVSATEALRVEFPRWLELGKGLDLRGRFVWVRAGTGAATEAGFAFSGLSRKQQSQLSALIQRLAEALREDNPDPIGKELARWQRKL